MIEITHTGDINWQHARVAVVIDTAEGRAIDRFVFREALRVGESKVFRTDESDNAIMFDPDIFVVNHLPADDALVERQQFGASAYLTMLKDKGVLAVPGRRIVFAMMAHRDIVTRELVEKALATGYHAVLPKPFAPDMVRKYLSKAAIRNFGLKVPAAPTGRAWAKAS